MLGTDAVCQSLDLLVLLCSFICTTGNNDAEFLKYAGMGVAMKNGSDYCKESARVVSEFTNDEHGVSRELTKLFGL